MSHPLYLYNKDSFLSAPDFEFWKQFSAKLENLQILKDPSAPHFIHVQYDLHISGPINEIVWTSQSSITQPTSLENLRKDEIWKSTCFEFFLAPTTESTSPYLEMNLNFSKEWNLYTLTSYRENLQPLDSEAIKKAPQFKVLLENAQQLVINIQTELETPWFVKRMGSTLILESTKGLKSYWALDHCSPHPDFHNKESFKIAF